MNLVAPRNLVVGLVAPLSLVDPVAPRNQVALVVPRLLHTLAKFATQEWVELEYTKVSITMTPVGAW